MLFELAININFPPFDNSLTSTTQNSKFMKIKIVWLVFLSLILTFAEAFGQGVPITGKVTDDMGPLPGASVVIKGTSKGVQTDFDGNYTIDATKGQTLTISYVGMKSKEVTIGTDTVIDVQLVSDNTLDEVIVTALGLEVKKDDDLSSSTMVDTEAVQKSGESGVIQGLAGKTSGLKITRNSGDPGAGAFIQIRGANTIFGSISPLIIVDGVPISNTNIGGGTGGVAAPSRLNDINQDDIADITVLKGASAAAIYGTGAANGVIVIRTKRGRGADGKVSINFKSRIAFDKINREFTKQDKFGQGTPLSFSIDEPTFEDLIDYRFVPDTGFSWGDKISERSGAADDVLQGNRRFEAEGGNIYFPIVNKNDNGVFNQENRDQVFRTGFTYENSISIAFGSQKSNTLLSYSDWDQEGTIRGKSSYKRQTLRLSNEFDISDNIKARISANYSKVKTESIQQGSNLNGLYLGYLRTSPDFDNRDYIGTYFNESGVQFPNAHRGYRRYLGNSAPTYNNPGWTVNEQKNPSLVNRFTFNPEINWSISDKIGLTARYGLDYYTDNRQQFFPVNSAGVAATGLYIDQTITSRLEDYNLFVSYNDNITDNFTIGAILGVNFTDNWTKNQTGTEGNFTNPFVGDLLLFGNADADQNLIGRTITNNKKSGGYAVLNATLFDQLLFEMTGRYERPSTLNEAIFYPSASIGWQFSKLIENQDILSFGKLRASYGEVGIEPAAYSNATLFFGGGIGSGLGATFGEVLVGSLYGNPFVRGQTRGNPNLKEERVKEFEVGADLRFANNKIRLGMTYYQRRTEDVLLNLTLPSSTGFTSSLENAAEISNKGVELDLGLQLVNTADFNWSIDINFARNLNLVEDLSGVETVFLNGFAGTSSNVVEGEAIGAIFGGRYLRDDDGAISLDVNGFPLVNPEDGVIGDPNPDWTGGLNTSISWKGLTLGAQFETSQGADMWAGTRGVLNYFGIADETANESIAPAGGIRNVNGIVYPEGTQFRGNIEDFGAGPVALDVDWYTGTGGGFGPLAEPFVDDASWTRLRELSLFYALPIKYFEKTGLTSIEFGVTGRNLVLWTDFEGIDPDLNLTGATLGRGLDYFTNPNTKSYIMTVNIGF